MRYAAGVLGFALTFAVSGAAFGQITPFEVGVGYGQSASFTKDSGGRGKLEGPVFTLSQALVSLPMAGEARIGVSAFLGGQLGSGGDADGNVYRVFARYRTPSVGSNLYGVIGAHYAFGKGRGGSFDEVSRIGGDIGVGMPFGPSVAMLPRASIEVLSHQSARSQLRGWSVSLAFRL